MTSKVATVPEPLVEAHDFSLQYPYAPGPTLRRLTLQLQQGERVLLLGPSGSGKSSLSLCLNALIPHSIEADLHGDLRAFGHATHTVEPATLARHIGIVFQDPTSQFCTLTVEDELAFGLENLALSSAEIDERIDHALRQVNLTAARHTRLDRLSGGMAQRVALAAALAMHPHLLILDEATSHLDPAGANAIFALVEQLAQSDQDRTFLLIEHRLDHLIETITRICVLDAQGQLAYDAPPRALFTQYGAELAALGIWLPPATALFLALRTAGIAQGEAWLTLPEALTWLRAHPAAWEAAATWSQPTALPSPIPDHSTTPPTMSPTISSTISSAVCLDHVTYAYPNSPFGLRDLSLTICRGEVLAIVGANGAGKSTLAQLIVGLLRPQQGTIHIQGRDSTHIAPSDLARQVGFVFQNPEHQFITDRVYDEVAFELQQQGVDPAAVTQRTQTLLTQLNLADKAQANPFTLSQGQKRRLSVATMLATERAILLLDEPTFGQDERNNRELIAELRRLQQTGMTLIIITHDMDLVWTLAQRVAVMGEGELLALTPPAQLFTNAALMQQAHIQPPARAIVADAIHQLTTVTAPP